MRKIKKLVTILMAAVMVVSLGACGKGGTENAETQAGESSEVSAEEKSSEAVDEDGKDVETKEGEDTVLTMYGNVASSAEARAEFNEVIKDFEGNNPGVKIELVLMEDPTGIATQQVVAGGGPDILKIDPTNVQNFASAGYLMDLSTYANEYGWNELFDEWALALCSRDGKVVALPEAVEALLVFYNKDMFAEKGWEVPTTGKEYFDLCEKMKAEGIIPNSFGNADFKPATAWWISSGYTAALGQEKLHALLQGDLEWESDDVKFATEQLADMWKKGYTYENSAGITLEDARNMLLEEKAAMMMSGQWDAFELMNDEPKFEWGAFKMPSWNESAREAPLPVALGGSYAINQKCQDPDMAAKFLDYIYNDEYVQQQVVRGTLCPTSNCNPSDITELDSHYVEVYDILLEAMEKNNIGYCTWTYWPPAVDTYAWSNLEALYLGQLSSDEFLKNLQEKYDEDVANGNVLEF